MSRYGRAIICVNCRAKLPVNRKNLRKRSQPGGFVCPKCERQNPASKRESVVK